MRSISTLLLALPATLFGQTIHIVEVGGFSNDPPAPYYSPSTLTIPVGDIVRWTNESGTHNVNGNTFFYPDNPEAFYSGEPDNGDWSYSKTFTIPGTYHYRCDSKGHADTQTGTIIVESGNGIRERSAGPAIVLFPSPVNDILKADVGDRTITQVEILGLDGRLITSPAFTAGPVLEIPTAALSSGNYVVRLTGSQGEASTHRFTKR